MNMDLLNNETILAAATALGDLRKAGLEKAITLATGLTGHNLEPGAKLLVPLLSPFRQSIARKVVPGNGTNWRAISAVARGGTLLSAEGTASAGFTLTKVDKSANYLSYGRLGSVTWEAVLAGMNFEDVKDRDTVLCNLLMLQDEECCILGGKTTVFGAGPTPTVVAATSGGALADAAYFVMVVALSGLGLPNVSRVARPTAGTNNYDFTSVPTMLYADGVGLVSAEGTATVSGGSGAGKITITFTPVASAAAYALFIGTTTGAANLKLQGIVTQSKVIVTAINTTGAVANATGSATDTSGSAPFSGIQEQLQASGSGAYVKRQNGAFSAVVGKSIPEIDAMLNDIYDRVKEEPDRLVMGWKQHEAIDNALASVTSDRIKLNIAVSGDGSVGNQLPRFDVYKSPRGKAIKLEEQSNIAGGIILALKDSVMLPNSDVPAPWQMHMATDIVRLDYAMTAPSETFEVRARGALAGYVPSFQGLIYDIREAA